MRQASISFSPVSPKYSGLDATPIGRSIPRWIDLKTANLAHQDIGPMGMYVRIPNTFWVGLHDINVFCCLIKIRQQK
jgi:hypothetical protein